MEIRQQLQRLFTASKAILPRLRQVYYVAVGQAVVAISGFIGLRLYTELLTVSAFGHAMLAIGLVALLDSVMGMALNQTLLSRCSSIADPSERRQLSAGLALIASAAATSLCLATGALTTLAATAGLIRAEWILAPVAISVYLSSEFIKHSLTSLLAIDKQYGHLSAWTATEALLTLVVTSATIYFWRSDAVGYIAGYTISRIFSNSAFVTLFSRGNHLKQLNLAIARRELKAAAAYGLPVSLMGPIGWITNYLDRYILGTLLGAATTGPYVAASALVSRPYAITTAVLSNYYRPKLYQTPSNHADEQDSRPRVMLTWISLALAIGGLGAIAFLFLGDEIAHLLLASDYRAGTPALMVTLAIAQTLSIMTHGADNAVLAMRGSAPLLKLQIWLSIATLVTIPIGCVLAGPIGAAAARSLVEATKLAATAALAITLTKRSVSISSSQSIDQRSRSPETS